MMKQMGFTLIETLVAIFVLLTAFAGITALAAQSLHTVTALKQRVVAVNLAHEGIELVRNIRDNNVHQGDAWDSDFCSPGGGSGYPCDREIACNADDCSGPPGPPVLLSPDTGRFLKVSSSGLYNYMVGTNTIYQRHIHFEQINPSEVRYVVTVTWSGTSFILAGTLNDWRPPSS